MDFHSKQQGFADGDECHHLKLEKTSKQELQFTLSRNMKGIQSSEVTNQTAYLPTSVHASIQGRWGFTDGMPSFLCSSPKILSMENEHCVVLFSTKPDTFRRLGEAGVLAAHRDALAMLSPSASIAPILYLNFSTSLPYSSVDKWAGFATSLIKIFY